MKRFVLTAVFLFAASLGLGGCGPMTGVMLAGNIVNAAGTAAVDASLATRDAAGEAERERGIEEHLAWIGAEDGDAAAAYALATLLTERHDPDARRWMCEAALKGNANAQLQLGHWYNEDRRREDLWPFISIAPDNQVAYRWYSAALENGDQRAGIFRESLADGAADAVALQTPGRLPTGCESGLLQAAPRAAAPHDA